MSTCTIFCTFKHLQEKEEKRFKRKQLPETASVFFACVGLSEQIEPIFS